ncbi:MAG: hypothetical protein H7249_01230 [Chitinophagaceae bacterium]|nr:hypothetical protein [Oligoflexus sp.]
MKSTTFRLGFLLAASLTLETGCQQQKQVEYAQDTSAVTAQPAAAMRRTFQYNAELVEKETLSLANASAFTMTLSGCASSQAASVTEANVYLELYEFDRNCVVKLTQFTLNGNVYIPKTGSDFTSWAVGQKAIFETVPGDDLNVEVISTVTDPITANGTVRYQFSEITKGSDHTIGEAVVRNSAVLTVNGQAAPNFTINQIALVGINATGNAEFQFEMQCAQAVTGAGATLQCYDVLLSDINMVLVEDTYGGVLTQANLDLIYTAAPRGGKKIGTGIAVNGGTPVIARGGFLTAATGAADVMVIDGSAPVHSHPNMLFILKAGPSYLYFNVDVTTIVQNGDH